MQTARSAHNNSLVQANAFIFCFGNKYIDSYWLTISDGEINAKRSNQN